MKTELLHKLALSYLETLDTSGLSPKQYCQKYEEIYKEMKDFNNDESPKGTSVLK